MEKQNSKSEIGNVYATINKSQSEILKKFSIDFAGRRLEHLMADVVLVS